MKRLIRGLRGFFGDQYGAIKKILGKDNVFLAKDFCKALGIRKIPLCPISYSVAMFNQCAEENEKGEQWRLVCKLGLSPAETRRLRPAEFSSASIWHNAPIWATRSCDSGYRLLNFKLASAILNDLTMANRRVARAHIGTVAEALVAIKILSKKKQVRMLTDSFHCGHESNGLVPLIGGYDEGGILLYTLPHELIASASAYESIGTILCLVPDNHDQKYIP